MVVTKEILTDFAEKFAKAQKLEKANSSAARSILKELKENVKNKIISEEDPEEQSFYKAVLAFIYRDLGKLEEENIYEVNETCVKFIEENNGQLKPENIIPYISALNAMGIERCGTNQTALMESKKLFSKAEDAYIAFKETNQTALSLSDILSSDEPSAESRRGKEELEKVYTLTVFYMAQVFEKLGDLNLSAEHCHKTLKRQLESNDYEPIDWALNAVTLSQYFLSPQRFTEARHHLAAATHILREYEQKMITPEMSEEVQASTRETFKYRYADVARCWMKYVLALLGASKEYIYKRGEEDNDDEEDDDNDEKKISEDFKKLTTETNENQKLLLFTPILDVSSIENQVTDEYCIELNHVIKIFNFVKEWFAKAKEYYSPDSEASQYAKIMIDWADIYKYLAFYEESSSNKSKFYKKRADCFEELLGILNPKYYLTECRICWYECAMAYGEMMDIKLDAIRESKDTEPSTYAIFKVNTLCDKAIKYLLKFIDSFKDQNGEQMKNIENDQMSIVLISYFHLGRIFYKIITTDTKKRLNNLQNSLKFYSLFIKECGKYPEASEDLKGEIGVCKEMVSVLPHKIQILINKIQMHEQM